MKVCDSNIRIYLGTRQTSSESLAQVPYSSSFLKFVTAVYINIPTCLSS